MSSEGTATSGVSPIMMEEMKINEVKINDFLSYNDERLYIKSVFFDQDVNWLIDSGAGISAADVSLIPKSVRLNECPDNLALNSASGHGIEIAGWIWSNITIGKAVFRVPLIICRGLRTKAILGIDFLRREGATIDYKKERLVMSQVSVSTTTVRKAIDKIDVWGGGKSNEIRLSQAVQVLPMQGVVVTAQLRKPVEELTFGLCTDPTLLMEEAAQVVVDGKVKVTLHNASLEKFDLKKGDVIGYFHPIKEEHTCEISELEKIEPAAKVPLKEKLRFMLENWRYGGPKQYKKLYWDLICKYQHVFSANKFDLGRTDVVQHKIRLKSSQPIHKKQYRIAWEHQQAVQDHVDELLKANCIQYSRSPFNAPIFCVKKPSGGVRVVQDFRFLNEESYEDRYVIREIQECLDLVGRKRSKVFSALDLTSGFWQMELDPESRQYTSFTVPGRGRFMWTVTPMGLSGSPASFARLMDIVMSDLKDSLTYLDDVLIHSVDHESHIRALEEVFKRLEKYNLKLNIAKCNFGAAEVDYLGFHISGDGVSPPIDKVEAIRDFPTPNTQHKVRRFVGATGWFRHFIPDYSRISEKLTRLWRTDSTWKGGPLPPESEKAFQFLRTALISRPILAHPDPAKEFILTVDASTGDETERGGLGAVLTQKDECGRERVIAYASRALKEHERNYSPYLIELAASVWGIEHFQVYLRARKFTLRTDHKPIEGMSRLHKKTMNRLIELRNEFSFDIQHWPGKNNNVADLLSRTPIEKIETASIKVLEEKMVFTDTEMADMQKEDPLCQEIRKWLEKGELPEEEKLAGRIKKLGNSCVIKNDVIRFKWIRKGRGEEIRYPILAPEILHPLILKQAHCSSWGGHGGQFRTLSRVAKVYWWPGMAAKVDMYVASCGECQAVKAPAEGTRVPLQPLGAETKPNQRCNIDLFGPLKTADGSKKYISVMTDGFSKYAEICAIPDKNAETVAECFFKRWVCRFGCPKRVVSDQGKEYCNKLSKELYRRLGIGHNRTSSLHPQTNSGAESFNREIIRYLKTMLQNETLEWEEHLEMLAFSYNTQVHKSTMEMPFFLTFLHEPNMPFFDMESTRPVYGETWAAEAFARLKKAYKSAKERLEETNDLMKKYFDKTAIEKSFVPGEDVFVFYPRSALYEQNPKLARNWRRAKIKDRVGAYTYVVKEVETRSQPTLVHAARLKKVKGDEEQRAEPPVHSLPDPESVEWLGNTEPGEENDKKGTGERRSTHQMTTRSAARQKQQQVEREIQKSMEGIRKKKKRKRDRVMVILNDKQEVKQKEEIMIYFFKKRQPQQEERNAEQAEQGEVGLEAQVQQAQEQQHPEEQQQIEEQQQPEEQQRPEEQQQQVEQQAEQQGAAGLWAFEEEGEQLDFEAEGEKEQVEVEPVQEEDTETESEGAAKQDTSSEEEQQSGWFSSFASGLAAAILPTSEQSPSSSSGGSEEEQQARQEEQQASEDKQAAAEAQAERERQVAEMQFLARPTTEEARAERQSTIAEMQKLAKSTKMRAAMFEKEQKPDFSEYLFESRRSTRSNSKAPDHQWGADPERFRKKGHKDG